ncbi:hypothetical protein HerbRD11066_42670 [Herbidospora sp. RD11066]
MTIRRMLAEARPDAFLPDLATSLNNQSATLSGLGRREEALNAIEEAVTIRRMLAEARPDTFLPDLATSLHNQSNHLAELGRGETARSSIEEAVAIRRALAEARPDAFLPSLALTRVLHGMILLQTGNVAESVTAALEGLAIAIERNLEDLIPAAADLLRRAYSQFPEVVAQEWKNLTDTEPPTWLTQ